MNKNKDHWMIDTVVIIEDDMEVRDSLTFLIERNNLQVESYKSAEHFLAMRTYHDHAIYIVDLNLPGLQGTDVIKTIRYSDKISPVFMLSGHKTEGDISMGLISGADDYLFKPFHPDHLMLKVNNAKTKTENLLKDMMNIGLRILPEAHSVVNDGVTVNFTPKEFVIVQQLLAKIDEVISRQDLMQENFDDVMSRNVDVQIFSIRKKIQKLGLEIETIRSQGYRAIRIRPKSSI
jgi:DNA-binding response OmpR family regulator